MTQGVLISPTLFNVVVNNVVRKWLTMTVEDQVVAQERLGLNMVRCLVVLYAYYGMIGAWYSEYLRNALNILLGLFWRYGIATHVKKSRKMTCQPGALRSDMSE